MEKDRLKKKNLDRWIPWTVFSLLLIYKLTVAVWLRTEPQVSDEFLYIRFAKALFRNGGYNSAQYPLFYPLFLVPSFLFGDNFYIVMKIMNAVASSFVPVCTYAIARLYLDERKSVIPTVFSAVIPFQYVSTATIMSENLYFPMLLLEIYLGLRPRKRVILCDIFYGILLGLMFMTRHITLVTIPVFLLIWLLRELEQKRTLKSILARGCMVVAFMGLAYFPWFRMCHYYGHSLKETIGFGIASKTNPEQLTMDRLLMTAGFYLCYFALILAPVLGLLFRSIRALHVKKGELFCRYNRLWCAVCGLAAAYFVAVTRHSWRVAYNYPVFEKIKGRYLIYFALLFVLLGTVVLFREKTKFKKKWIGLLTTYLLPAGLIIAGYLVDIAGIVYPLQNQFIGEIESMDGQLVKYIGPAYVVVTVLFVFLFQYLHDFSRAERKRHLTVIFGVGLILIELWGMPTYLSRLQKIDEDQVQTNDRYAWELCAVLDAEDLPEGTFLLLEDVPDRTFIRRYLRMYNYSDVLRVVTQEETVETEEYYVLTTDADAYKDVLLEMVATFSWGDEDCCLLKVRH